MDIKNKATKINLFSLSTLQMRTFHMTWFAFFLCFFGWFGIAPLMAVVRDELMLTKAQVGNTIIASVAITILARLFIGWLCDRIGPRLAYTGLLIFGSVPVMCIGLANSYESFLLFRLAIGVIGASFVITQYHTSMMFAPNVVGTANATTAGWGNLGGGVTQIGMPLIFAAIVAFGANEALGWRIAMIVPGIAMVLTAIAYFKLTKDTPEGNFKDLRAMNRMPDKSRSSGAFLEVCKDSRVWALFFIYAACFGIELTINNVAALYFADYFSLGLKTAGLMAALFGLMNIFARTLGGVFSDRFAKLGGLKGRVRWLMVALFCEGIALMAFSRMSSLPLAIGVLLVFSLFVQMSEGATYSVVPFINKKALGAVAGIVGAGGNAGAVAAGFLFKGGMEWPQAFLVLGALVTVSAVLALAVRFSEVDELEVQDEWDRSLAEDKAFVKEDVLVAA